MNYINFSPTQKEKYKKSLQIVGSLSALFSDSKIPYLYYRIAEKIYCESFDANDHSRGDITIDASLNGVGIGLKTFLRQNDKTLQKIAEFNKLRDEYSNIKCPKEYVKKIAYLRNQRINFAHNQCGLNSSIYHCIVRDISKFLVFEQEMKAIDIDYIHDVQEKSNTIYFCDQYEEYSFNKSKSTLFKRFNTLEFVDEFEIKIFDNPLQRLSELLNLDIEQEFIGKDYIYLPLYSEKGLKHVPEKSQLNQWNACGRKRHPNEVYIPHPVEVRRKYPNFFPDRDTPFNLHLPDKNVMTAKICQDDGKALMSSPNKELGEWLLRKVLNIPPNQLLTLEKLEELDIDSVRIDKIDNVNYMINFAKLGSYDNFIKNK